MPSSSFVEVDISNNNTAILDSSSETVVIAPAPPSEPHEESEEHNAISPFPPKSVLNTTGSQECVSPLPPKKLVMEAKTAAKGKKAAKSTAISTNASTSVVTPSAKKATAATLTPPKAAVATPGDSAKKMKKKTGLTLDSFFSKGKKPAKSADKPVGKQAKNKPVEKSVVDKTPEVLKEDTAVEEKTNEDVAGKEKTSTDVKKSVKNESTTETKSTKKTKPPSKPTAKTPAKAAPKITAKTPSFLENDEDSPAHAVAVAMAQTMGRRRGKRAAVSVLEKTGAEESDALSTDVMTCGVESAGTEKTVASSEEQIEKDSPNTVDVQQSATAQDASAVQPTENRVNDDKVDKTDDDDKTMELDEDKIITINDSNSNSSQPSVFTEKPAPIDEVICTENVQVESPIKSSEEHNSPNDAVVIDPPKKPKSEKSKKKTAGKSASKAAKSKGMSIADSFKMFTAAPSKPSKSTFNKSVTSDVTEGNSKMVVEPPKPPAAASQSEPNEVADAQPPDQSPASVAEELQVSEPTSVVNTSTAGQSSSSKAAAPKEKSVKTPKPSANKNVPTKTSVPPSDENSAKMNEYSTLRERYVIRAVEVASRSASDEFVEESLCDAYLPSMEKGSVEIGADGVFPDELLNRLLVLVQGSNLPLSLLSKKVLDTLSEFTNETRSLTTESISSKIKLIAQRKPYLSGNPPSPSEKPTPLAKLDCFEDANECYLWRWELSSIDLLPQKEAAKVKKARTTRKKLQSHHAAIIKLISSIDNATKWLQKNPTCSAHSTLAKVSEMEEKVLKFEREEERARLLKEAKAQKEKAEADDKQKEKERLEQEKAAAKKLKDEEKAKAAKEREEAKETAKRQKEEEKLKQQREAEEKELKRKARLMSFFGGSKKKQKTKNSISGKEGRGKITTQTFDSDAFRSMINSADTPITNPFSRLSRKARSSRQRKTRDVKVSVYVTVLSDNPFAPQPYDEEKVISVQNKYKFLGFHEDDRPPYHGTWSKRSSIVTGRRPLGKDTEYLDYDVDSEAEWEQVDEDGEDCDKSEGEEEEVPNDDDNDSWLAAEDELEGLDDEDQETRELRKKKLLSQSTISAKACVIAPMMGGISHELSENALGSAVEGFNPQDAMDLLASHATRVLIPSVVVCLDAFPPVVREEQEPKASSQKMSLEAQILIAKFIHNSTINSKEKIITELLNAHPTVTSSRAQAMRELEVTSEKRRLPNGGGVVWEVKAEHLEALVLTEKDLKPPPAMPEESKKETSLSAKRSSAEKSVASAPVPTSPVPAPSQPKQSKKRTKPAVSAASANLFAAFIKNCNKKQKTA